MIDRPGSLCRLGSAAALLCLGLAACDAEKVDSAPTPAPMSAPISAPASAAADPGPAAALTAAGYLGNEACTACHAEIAKAYGTSAKAHTLSPPGALPAAVVDDPKSGTRTRITPSPEGPQQMVARVRHDGTVLETTTRTGRLAIGSGKRVQTLATLEPGGRPDRADAWEMPYSWFPGLARWALSPGHGDVRLGPRFKFGPECLFCHSAAAALPASIVEAPPTDAAAWRWVGLGCERCHGPGRAHVEAAGKVPTPSAGADASTAIARCEQCHTFGVARVFAADWDLLPPAPSALSRTLSIFVGEQDAPDGTGPSFSQSDRLRRSACFQGSQGRMQCSTCHDPHATPPDPAAAMAARCGTCHTPDACKRDRARAEPTTVDCAGCHMVRRPPGEEPHAGTTDHWIRRTLPQNPSAPAPGAPDAAMGVRALGDLPPLTVAEAQARLGVARLRVADLAHDANLLAQAEATLAGALSTEPGNPQALAGMGSVDLLMARWREAVEHLEGALRAAPRSDANRLRLVRALVGAERLPEATDQLVLMSAGSDEPDEIRREAARVAGLRGDAAAAISLYQAATAARPANPELHRDLGTLYLQVGRPDDAVQSFAAACRWSACNVPDLLLVSQFFVQSQAAAQAVKILDFGRELLGPEAGRTLENEAVKIESAHGLDADHLKSLGRAFDRNPKDAAAAQEFGDRLFELGQAESAIQVYEKCVNLGGADESLLRKLGVAHGVNGKLPKAEEYLRRALAASKRGGEPRTWNELGMALSGQNRRPEAIEAFRNATRRDPKFAYAWFNMALAYQVLDKPVEGLAAVQKGLAAAPTDAQALQLRRTLAIAVHGTRLSPAELDRLAPLPASAGASAGSPPP